MAMPKAKTPGRPGISEEQRQRVLAHWPNWRFALMGIEVRMKLWKRHRVIFR
jgi:hypothetical protein